jgi:hypothetical protein
MVVVSAEYTFQAVKPPDSESRRSKVTWAVGIAVGVITLVGAGVGIAAAAGAFSSSAVEAVVPETPCNCPVNTGWCSSTECAPCCHVDCSTSEQERVNATCPSPPPSPPMIPGVCTNTCEDNADGICDDGGDGAEYDICEFGSDCDDCMSRAVPPTAPPIVPPGVLPP